MKQINKEIAAVHSAAALKYMDTLKLNDDQKVTLIDSLTQDKTDIPIKSHVIQELTAEICYRPRVT